MVTRVSHFRLCIVQGYLKYGGNFPTNDVILASANKLMTVASADINLQRKHNVICHIAKVKPATSAHSMADVIPFLVYLMLASNPTLR